MGDADRVAGNRRKDLRFVGTSGERRCVMLRALNRGLAAAATLIPALTMPSAIAISQPDVKCAGHSDVQNYLGRIYAEKLEAVGLVNDQTIMEIYVGDSGSWTVALTSPEGISCLVLSGQGWQSMDRKPGQKA
jgi:hypothetical protein